jgi:hypothetical protein
MSAAVPLSAEALKLLDMLCHAKAAHCRVTNLKSAAMNFRLGALRDAALVNWHSYEPTPWAFHDWEQRQNEPQPEVTPPAEAQAAAVLPSEPPPATPPRPTGAELATKLEAWAKANGASINRLSLQIFQSQTSIRFLRKSQRPVQATIAKVEAFLADPVPADKLPPLPGPPRKAPLVNPFYGSPESQVTDAVRAARTMQRVKQNVRKQARAALDAGISPAAASPNAGVRGAMRDLREADEAARRAADPIEQAKTVIRAKGFTCFDATVVLGEKKGRDRYIIRMRSGDKICTAAELLAEAERLKQRA